MMRRLLLTVTAFLLLPLSSGADVVVTSDDMDKTGTWLANADASACGQSVFFASVGATLSYSFNGMEYVRFLLLDRSF